MPVRSRSPSHGIALPHETEVRSLRGPLVRWYRAHRRDLPWRRTSDPYAIWVSETMLQQTRVATALPYYRRFLDRFPDVASLASASEEAVLSRWSGLGYYSRARALRAGAIAVMDRHGGRVPDDLEALRGLPGIGPYTAGAIASLAFGRPEPALDGNVRRVLSRLFMLRGAGTASEDGRLWEIARVLARGPAPGDLNQALMELGALVCTPRAPACSVCPVARRCHGRAAGCQESFPSPRPRRALRSVRVAVAIVRLGGRILLERPRGLSPLRGTWDVPAVAIAADGEASGAIETELHRRHGLSVRANRRTATASHAILDNRLRLEVFDCRLCTGKPPQSVALRWARPADLADIPVSGATRKALRAARRAPRETVSAG